MHKSTEKKSGLRHIRRHKPIRALVALLALAATGAIGGAAGVIGAYYYVQPGLPAAETIRDVPLQIPLRIYSRDGYLISEIGERRRILVSWDELPPHVVDAFVAAEDQRFFAHPGIDYRGILRAVVELVTTGDSTGGSTLTQQLARDYFLSRERRFARKLREAFLAWKIEREFTKEQIMALFLNKMFFGQRAYGVAAAARVYFDKSLAELSVGEAATLAGVLPAPSRYNPVYSAANAEMRRGYVLGRMHDLGYIDDATYDDAMAQPMESRLHGANVELSAPYVAEMVRAEMLRRYGKGAYTDGYRVVTSLDSRLQEAANHSLRNGLLEFTRRRGYKGPIARVEWNGELAATDFGEWPIELRELLEQYAPGGLSVALVTAVHEDDTASLVMHGGVTDTLPWKGMRWAKPFLDRKTTGAEPETAADVVAAGDLVHVMPTTKGTWALAQVPEAQGAVVSIDPFDGAIAALTGGFDFTTSKFNRATQAYRQPGSSFKPFIYSAALEHGNTPATVVLDSPVVIKSSELEAFWRPINYSGRFYGPTRLRDALRRSMNLVSVRLLLSETGVGNAVRHIGKFGFGGAALPYNGSLALGGGTATPLDMAQGYGILANGGRGIRPYVIDAIYGPEGETLYRADPAVVCTECLPDDTPEPPFGDEPAGQMTLEEMAEIANDYRPDASVSPELFENVNVAPEAITPQNAFLIQDMMRSVVRNGTGVRAWRELRRNDLSGKTGTSNDRRDAWFGGFNADLTAVVWVGYDDDLPLGPGEEGSRTALPIWIEFARVAFEGVPENRMPMPEGIVTVRIDAETGCPARANQRNFVFEVFREGNVPECEVVDEAPDIFNDASSIDPESAGEGEEETES
ncbi:MAG: PBP1A family penicillin-binding protein, partial [Proteobacteria bacterium]|nr:PBP1A family penicillin-binding protein [Pseudomonadota bacterium]